MLVKRASTLIEALLGLTIILLITPIFVHILRVLLHFPEFSIKRQNDIGLIQLRRVLSLGHSHEVKHDTLCMNYRDDLTCFDLYDDKLRQSPGTQYYLVGLDDVYFKKEQQWILLGVVINDELHEYGLIHVE